MAWSSRATLAAVTNGQYSVCAAGSKIFYVRSDGTAMFTAHSSDEGVTWSGETNVAAVFSIPLDQPLVRDPVTGRLHLFNGSQDNDGSNPAILQYRHSDDNGVTWSTRLGLDDGSTHGNNRFYRLAFAARNGVCTLVYTSESSSTFTTDGIFMRRSTDGGVTWGSATQLYSGTTANPLRPFIWDDGTHLHLVWYDTSGAFDGTHGGDVFYARSSDQGATWSGSPIQISTGLASGRPTVCSNGTTATVVWMQGFGIGISSDIHIATSTNGGTSFGSPSTFATHGGAGGGYTHPFLIQSGNDVYAFWTDVGGSPNTQLLARYSADGGQTFGGNQVVFTYDNATGSSDAPIGVFTTSKVIAFGADAATGNAEYASLPRSFAFTFTGQDALLEVCATTAPMTATFTPAILAAPLVLAASQNPVTKSTNSPPGESQGAGGAALLLLIGAALQTLFFLL